MSVTSITASPVQTTPVHHGHHAHGSKGSTSSDETTTQSTASETLEQRAEQGDPTAIAELRAERQLRSPTAAPPSDAATPHGGATEPGKGEQVDEYA
jgi:hypothetical protein